MVVILPLKKDQQSIVFIQFFQKKMKLYGNKHQNTSPFEQNIKQCVKKKD